MEDGDLVVQAAIDYLKQSGAKILLGLPDLEQYEKTYRASSV